MFKSAITTLVLTLAFAGVVSAQSRFALKIGPSKEVRRNVHVLYAGNDVNVSIAAPRAGQVYLLLAPALGIARPDMSQVLVLESLSFENAGSWTKTYTIPDYLVGTAFSVRAHFVPESGRQQASPMMTLLIAADAADAKARGLKRWGFGTCADCLFDAWDADDAADTDPSNSVSDEL